LKRLVEIVAAGGTAVRAAAALKRTIASCRNQARKMGTPFRSAHTARKEMREKCAAAERESTAR